MSPPSKKRRAQPAAAEVDIMEHIQNLDWCKSEWTYIDLSKESKELLKKCVNSTKPETEYNVKDVIKKSEEFPVPFPIDTVRLKELKKRRPNSRLKRNINSTYTVIHERVLILMAEFLHHKR
ncbi:uncharacterized protein LOC121728301 [Aricia agestis]|uniref:uncharacterized protein LOC121728301 n=1 Tax=Aricia agestis TaxID=91739 RepID=UPI001C20A06F|nr:uncharacterized protein LOC121728301 [Aricia agestis]